MTHSPGQEIRQGCSEGGLMDASQTESSTTTSSSTLTHLFERKTIQSSKFRKTHLFLQKEFWEIAFCYNRILRQIVGDL